MDHALHQSTLPQRLQYLKCTQCRKDKKKVCLKVYLLIYKLLIRVKCLPLDRSWPDQKCDRCSKHKYACSASRTTKQEREAIQSLASSLPLPSATAHQTTGPGLATGGIEHQYNDGPLDRSPCKPKCAVYFNTLAKSHWGSFGVRPEPTKPLASMYLRLSNRNAEQVYSVLMLRLSLVQLANKYTKAVDRGVSTGLTTADARLIASRRLAFEAGMAQGVRGQGTDSQLDELVQDFEGALSLALQWNALLDAVCVPEILLMRYDPGDELYWDDDVPVPRTELARHQENTCPLTDVLSPELALKETCLRLSGLVDMIKRLKEMDCPQLRKFLAKEIERRVRDVLGDPETFSDEEDCTEEDSDGESDRDSDGDSDGDSDSDEIMEDAD